MLKVRELNKLDREDFTRALAGLFEHSPWIPARTFGKQPFIDRGDLFEALRETVMKASDDEKLALIRAHPDLVGNATLTAESQREQTTAGLGTLSPGEIERFRELNAQYREKFGFPFVICARMNKKEVILEAFPIRLQNSREREMETALREIFKIAEFRIDDLVE